VQVSTLMGYDRFQQEGVQYSPNFLQFEPADGFLGTAGQNNVSSLQSNAGVNAVWTWTPGNSLFTSFTTSVGGTYERQKQEVYRIRGRGLLPTRRTAAGAQDVADGRQRTEFRDQSYYVNEQALLFNEKLALNAGFRADRSSANGDRRSITCSPSSPARIAFESDHDKDRRSQGPRRVGAVGQPAALRRSRHPVRGRRPHRRQQLAGVGRPARQSEHQAGVMNELEFGYRRGLFKSRSASSSRAISARSPTCC
jgi:hypothetical protein